MIKSQKVFFGLILVLGFVYMYPASPEFPVPPPDSVQSMEPADTETPLRRAYFTNYTREQVIEHYKAHFDRKVMFNLNYPPEDAQTLIRDQTRSWYLEELVHPMRESLFINGFIPQEKKDDIWYKGQHFEEKITIRYIPSGWWARIVVLTATTLLGYLLMREWWKDLIRLSELRR
ncbi:hypothetical protein A2415_05210 [candidate division WWE3 bacterium RIFOXYC1_FULL_39_7]|uniref:Uncharacterized protein n=1 Tax=candidate division WWE3 bacterium RIFOXYC1_FULL_39_7 TaxID=1802643 RepID=A0A1F4WJF6_UNCKA|nr:MAG: hypothetical protein A2415_05210 [candidate division WWE3 bacterium RIFOXYC1_FULL_39_7]